jgi:hypothetical protein
MGGYYVADRILAQEFVVPTPTKDVGIGAVRCGPDDPVENEKWWAAGGLEIGRENEIGDVLKMKFRGLWTGNDTKIWSRLSGRLSRYPVTLRVVDRKTKDHLEFKLVKKLDAIGKYTTVWETEGGNKLGFVHEVNALFGSWTHVFRIVPEDSKAVKEGDTIFFEPGFFDKQWPERPYGDRDAYADLRQHMDDKYHFRLNGDHCSGYFAGRKLWGWICERVCVQGEKELPISINLKEGVAEAPIFTITALPRGNGVAVYAVAGE